MKKNFINKTLLLKYFANLVVLRTVVAGLLLLTSLNLEASECYNYHTITTQKIIVKNDGVFYQLTEKDPNGFSYVQQIYKPLKGIDKASYKAIGEDESTFMFADKNGFYMLPKLEQYEKNIATYSKILGGSGNQKHINGRLFLIDNKWVYFNAWGKNITKIVLKELPANLSNIKSYSNGLYIKSDKQVFMISVDLNEKKPYSITSIPNLNPAKVVYYACRPLNNDDYIADENHMISIRREGSFEDVTPQFMALGLTKNFNILNLVNKDLPMWLNGNKVLKKREGTSISGRNPLNGDEIDIMYSYSDCKPLNPEYGNLSYILFRNHIYPLWDDNFSQPYDVKTDATKLKAIEGKLFKGTDFYYFEADNDFKIISTGIAADAKFFPGVYSYYRYLPKALVSDKYIHFIGDRFNINLKNQKKLTSPIVKQLGMFYLLNNSLFDGENTYQIEADYETLSYLGSFVEIINGCSGDMINSEQVGIKYHNFFKDKDAVYYFDGKSKRLQIIQTASPTDYISDNYEELRYLYKIKDKKGSAKKKSIAAANIYAISAGIFIALSVGFYLYKKNQN